MPAISSSVSKGELSNRAGDGAKKQRRCLSAQTELAEAVLERNTRLGERGAASEATRLAALRMCLIFARSLDRNRPRFRTPERSLSHAEVRAEFGALLLRVRLKRARQFR